MLISFLGSLPLGTLNVAAMQISITDGIIQALQFSLGSLLAEVIYVRLSLVAMDWVRKKEFLFLPLRAGLPRPRLKESPPGGDRFHGRPPRPRE